MRLMRCGVVNKSVNGLHLRFSSLQLSVTTIMTLSMSIYMALSVTMPMCMPMPVTVTMPVAMPVTVTTRRLKVIRKVTKMSMVLLVG